MAKWAAWIFGGVAMAVIFSLPTGNLCAPISGYDTVILEAITKCATTHAALGDHVKLHVNGVGLGAGCGQEKTGGGTGHAAWTFHVAGDKGTGSLDATLEQHGGNWSLTSGRLKTGDTILDLADCNRAPVKVTREELVGLWGIEKGADIILAKLEADGTFAGGLVKDGKSIIRHAGTWELKDGALIWHFDKTKIFPAEFAKQVPADDVNPILEFSRTRMVLREMSGKTSEHRALDPTRFKDFDSMFKPK